MSKSNIQNIVLHIDNSADLKKIEEKVNQFHIEVIERKLANSNLTKNDKITVINKIIENLMLNNNIVK